MSNDKRPVCRGRAGVSRLDNGIRAGTVRAMSFLGNTESAARGTFPTRPRSLVPSIKHTSHFQQCQWLGVSHKVWSTLIRWPVQTDKGRRIQPEHGDTIDRFGETTVDFDVLWIFQKHRDVCDVNM
jgi:hypothetical protein